MFYNFYFFLSLNDCDGVGVVLMRETAVELFFLDLDFEFNIVALLVNCKFVFIMNHLFTYALTRL